MKHYVPCPKCGADDWTESAEDEGSLADGGTYVKYKCLKCGHETGWVMLPD